VERIIRVQTINGRHKVLCPKTGEFEYLNNSKVFHCSPRYISNKKIGGCEHYRSTAGIKFLSEFAMEQEYLPAEVSHIICEYSGEVHQDWKKLGLDPEWGLVHSGIREKERLRIIKESGSEPVPRTRLSKDHSLYPDDHGQEVELDIDDSELEQQIRLF